MENNIKTLNIIDTLNDYEKNIIKLIIINGYSPAEIAKKNVEIKTGNKSSKN